jgi:hypothetical protein
MTIEELSPPNFQLSGLFDHSSPGVLLIPPVVHGIPLQLVADPKKDALSGVDGF